VAEKRVVQPLHPPELAEARIDIDEDPRADRIEDPLVGQIAHEVHQRDRSGRSPVELVAVHAQARATLIAQQCEVVSEPCITHNGRQPCQLTRRMHRRSRVRQHVGLESVDEQHVEPQVP
jgi:hypothetical protein